MIIVTGRLKGGTTDLQDKPVQAIDIAKAYGLPKPGSELKIQLDHGKVDTDQFGQQKVNASIWPPTSYSINNGDGTMCTLTLAHGITPKVGGGVEVRKKDVVIAGADIVFDDNSYEDFVIVALGPLTQDSPSMSRNMAARLSVYDRSKEDALARAQADRINGLYDRIKNLGDEELKIRGIAMGLPGITSVSTPAQILAAIYQMASVDSARIEAQLSSEDVTIRGIVLRAINDGIFEQKGNAGVPHWFWGKGELAGQAFARIGDGDSTQALINVLTQQEYYSAYFPLVLRLLDIKTDVPQPEVKEEPAPPTLSEAQAVIFQLLSKGIPFVVDGDNVSIGGEGAEVFNLPEGTTGTPVEKITLLYQKNPKAKGLIKALIK